MIELEDGVDLQDMSVSSQLQELELFQDTTSRLTDLDPLEFEDCSSQVKGRVIRNPL